MKLQEAIKKAIEGGWKNGWRLDSCDAIFVRMEKMDASCNQPIVAWMIERPLLDPLFWQSIGKAMGVKNNMVGSCDGCGADLGGWKYQQHCFIDHLQDGKSIESFFEQLT